jgi:hypothetical protein
MMRCAQDGEADIVRADEGGSSIFVLEEGGLIRD